MTKNDRRPRPALLTGVAMLGLALGHAAAHAEELKVKEGPAPLADDADAGFDAQAQTARLLADAADVALERQSRTWAATRVPAPREPDPAILIALPGTPTTARDPVNITGVGQMVVPSGAGTNLSLGLCTGSLINPRTVLFAAHCVNDLPANAYGSASGGQAIGFGFNASNNSTLPGAPVGTSPLRNWLFGSATQGRAANTTSAAENFYTAEGVAYNPLSLEPAANGFLYGDIAIAALDTPARNIPTWSLLFSPLPAPGQITAASGTGYHVALSGYGGNGTGTSGNQGIDFRRRVAENWLGALTSLVNFETFLFGGSDPRLTQNLYFLDFDDPARGTATASRFDFNAFRDNGLPREGITAGGDSGGPLILDQAFSRQLVIGVLSGGFPSFFNGQPDNSYGVVSFYQPLYLYWDWIAANNPYRYVSAKAGDGNWEDASRWVSLQDPAYFILGPDGQPINGVPTQLGEQNNGTAGKFGQICFQTRTFSECEDQRTGTLTFTADPIGTGAPSVAGAGGSAPAPQNPALALPAATIANGLPGATNFVPNNTPGNRLEGVLPRYFDVTLSNAGTTRLGSSITIDRLTLTGAAGLNIAAAGRLAALNDVTQRGGTMTVTGALVSSGDYLLATGLLQGTGNISAPFLTSIAGTIAPNTIGTLGTLSLTGNLVLSSASLLHIDVNGASSDRLAVTGAANVGGIVSVGSGITGQVNGLGRQFTILTATGGVTGTFTPGNLTPILSQRFTYQANAVLMTIQAASYTTVIETGNPVQAAYAQLLDQNRANEALAGLYGLDFASVDTIRATFNGLAPVNEQAVRSMAAQTVNTLQNLNDARLREADKDRAGGKVAITGRPLELAQMSLAPTGQPLGGALMAMQEGAEDTELNETNLPENVAIFLSGGYVTGDIGQLPGFTQRSDMDGYVIAGGIEFYPGESTMLGLSGFYGTLDADTPLGQRVESDTYAASLYLRHRFARGPVIDGQFSMGTMGFDTRRTVQFLGASQTLTSRSDDLLVSGALGISYDLATGIGTISPGIEARYASVDLTTLRETGGTLALAVDRETFKSTQARFGFDYDLKGRMASINAVAQLVWEFEDGPQLLGANFVQGTGPNANFALRTADQTWGEVGASATFGTGPLTVSAGFDTTIGRSNADAQVVRGTATWRF
ncbi:autotransporter domain-containing protein [Erythrobacter sp. NE805]|uniref:autotransporter domain-containing protein n=1 Tax=Erythrobacter sp. NE805 TaxID=3389875 RepID=UPI00396B4412